MPIRIATFNVENLFARYRFRSSFSPVEGDGFTRNDLAFDIHDETVKKITAKAVKDTEAHVICLQEVESLEVLDRFYSRFLAGHRIKHGDQKLRYRYRLVVDSHDPRYIDVAVLSCFPFVYLNTHREERNQANTTWLFSRDCLEVDLDVDGKILSLYVNHLKSMLDRSDPANGRKNTRARREEQCRRVAEIIDSWWKPGYDGNFAVIGDLNDYPETGHGLGPLLTHPGLVNVNKRLPADQRWTHYYAREGQYKQLDYILLGKALARNSSGPPQILRKGLPWRAERYEGERYDEVGENYPKASDHCPLSMDIDLI